MPTEPVRIDPDLLRPSGALLATHISLGRAIDRALEGAGHDPTVLDLIVRLSLAPDERLRAVDLCSQLLLSPSHVSRMLDRAEEAGLVERGPDPSDRRANLVHLTGAGRDVAVRIAPRLHGILNEVIYDTLDADEIESLVGYLDRIETAARRTLAAD